MYIYQFYRTGDLKYVKLDDIDDSIESIALC